MKFVICNNHIFTGTYYLLQMNKNIIANKDSGIVSTDDIKSIWKIFLKNWYIVVLCLLLSYGFSFFYSYRLTDRYAAQTQILLKSKETGYADQINQGIGYYWWVDYSQQYTDELEIIRSFDIVAKTVNKLKLDVSYYIVGRLKTAEVYEFIPFEVNVINVNSKMHEVPIFVRFIDVKSCELSYDLGEGRISKICSFGQEIIDSDFTLKINKKSSIGETSVDDLAEVQYMIKIHDKESLVYKYQSAITVVIPEKTAILNLAIQDEVPQRAVAFIDTLSRLYIQNSLVQKYTIIEKTLEYIDKQLEEVVSVLQIIEDDLENYKENKAILDLSQEESEYFSKLLSYEGQKTELNHQIASINALEKYIVEDKDPELLPPSFYVKNTDEFLKKSVAELYTLQMQINGALYNATDKSYSINEAQLKIKKLKENILIYINNTKTAINLAIVELDREIGKYQGSIRAIPKQQRDLLNIQRKLQVNEKMYLFLLEKKANTIIAKAGIIPETQIIEAPRSLGVVWPDKQKLLYTHLTIGMSIAVLIAMIRFLFFSRVESLDELKKLTHLPVIGEILYSKLAKTSYVVVDVDPKSPITESFRSLRTNMQYISPDTRSQIILITSNNPGEGKTFTSINLAAILAKASKKVLLLELDLHKPKVHTGLNMNAEIGMSTLLIGKCKAEDTIVNSPIANLDVILSGPTPPNSSELILSPHLADLFDYAQKNYDYIIIDTPPVGLISDGVMLMKYADAIFFVINTNYPNKKSIANVHEITNNNKLSNTAFILNGVKQRRSRYYYNRYSYGYGYRYGYGNSKKS